MDGILIFIQTIKALIEVECQQKIGVNLHRSREKWHQ